MIRNERREDTMSIEANNNNRRISYKRVLELRERHGAEARDMANRLLDDPMAADDVMRLAFLKLRRMKEADLPGDEKLRGMLADIVVRICLRRTGCGGCVEEVFRNRERRLFTYLRMKQEMQELQQEHAKAPATNDDSHRTR